MKTFPLFRFLRQGLDRFAQWYYQWRFDLHLRYLGRRCAEKP